MKKGSRLLLHIAIVLAVIVVVLVAGTLFVTQFIEHPELYIGGALSSREVALYVGRLGVVLASVLLGYITYLLIVGRGRAELAARFITRNIAAEQEEFREMYDSAPVPYFTLHADGTIKKANKAALRLLHTTDEKLLGTNFFSLFHKDDEAAARQCKEYFRRNVPVDRKEARIVTKSGDMRWVLFSLFETRRDSEGRIGIATLFDITEAKRLDEAKSDFVSLASHQLRTPLAAMRWQTDFLLGKDAEPLTEKQHTYIERIRENNKTMIELVDGLLNVSRIETGKITPELKETNGIELAESVLLELAPLIHEKEIQVARVFNDEWKLVRTDPRLLRMVFQNLLSNAVRYTPPGGRVAIELGYEGRTRRIIVSDTGYGIPASARDRIFTKTFRADNVRKIDPTGTGLGLYLVKEIAGLLGGSVGFVSEEGKGTTFTVAF